MFSRVSGADLTTETGLSLRDDGEAETRHVNAAIDLVQRDTSFVERLRENTRYFREQLTSRGVRVREGISPIVPIIIGDTANAISMSQELLKRGVYVSGFGFPVVPQGQARLRCQISAAHTREHLDRAIHAISEIALNVERPDISRHPEAKRRISGCETRGLSLSSQLRTTVFRSVSGHSELKNGHRIDSNDDQDQTSGAAHLLSGGVRHTSDGSELMSCHSRRLERRSKFLRT